jgi:hypothetical protein
LSSPPARFFHPPYGCGAGIAAKLVEMLAETNQEVPAWLQNMSQVCGWFYLVACMQWVEWVVERVLFEAGRSSNQQEESGLMDPTHQPVLPMPAAPQAPLSILLSAWCQPASQPASQPALAHLLPTSAHS